MTITRRQQKAVENRFDQIVKAAEGTFFQLDGTPTFDIKKKDGSFRRKPVPTDIGYQLSHIYLGQKGQIILGFMPEDARDWEYFECEAGRLDTFMPLLATELSKFTSLDTPIEKLQVFLDAVAQTAIREFDEAEKLAAENAMKNYDSNEEFGAF